VVNGKFAAVGTLAEVQAAVGNARIDRIFEGKTVSAGFIEPHVHPLLAAVTMSTKVISIEDWDAIDGFSPAVRDPKGYEQRLREALEAHRKGPNSNEVFVTWGYHHYMHGDAMSRELLNKLAPDFPVIVWHRSTHELFFNDAGLKLAGIDKAVVDAMTKSQRDMVNWERGHFFEQGQIAVYGKVLAVMTSKEKFRKGLEFTKTFYHRAGITTSAEPGGSAIRDVQEAYNSVYSADSTPFNHYFFPEGKSPNEKFPGDTSAMLADTEKVLTWGSGRTRFLPKQVKLRGPGRRVGCSSPRHAGAIRPCASQGAPALPAAFSLNSCSRRPHPERRPSHQPAGGPPEGRRRAAGGPPEGRRRAAGGPRPFALVQSGWTAVVESLRPGHANTCHHPPMMLIPQST
jgi:hypothetical protein